MNFSDLTDPSKWIEHTQKPNPFQIGPMRITKSAPSLHPLSSILHQSYLQISNEKHKPISRTALKTKQK